MNVRERHETQCHIESGVFIVPLIVMVIYIYIYIYIYMYIYIYIYIYMVSENKLKTLCIFSCWG